MMANNDFVSDAIQQLRDIEQRSYRAGARLSQQNEQNSVWTAIDFQIAQKNYLIPLAAAKEVFPVPVSITSVPLAKPWVFGIANLRGELLPLFDLKCFLYGETTTINKRSRILVINYPNLYSGLLVEGVIGLKHFQTKPTMNSTPEDNHIAAYLDGSISQKGRSWDVFSFNKLASDQQFLNAAI